MRFLLIIFFAIILCRLPSGAQSSGGKADFFVCENPRALIIKNRYQQNLSGKELNRLSPFTPWRIVEENMLLSDQFTAAMKVSYKNQSYYLLKDENGKVLYTANAGKTDFYRNCVPVHDTIEITRDRFVSFSRQYSGGGFIRYFNSGERIFRLFKYRSAYFSETTSAGPDFGWIRSSGGRGWQPFSEPRSVVRSTIPDDLRDKIIAKFAEVNQTYQTYFSFFNTKYDSEKEKPRWVVVTYDEKITAGLEPLEYASRLNESTKYLLNDLENILLGTEFGVSFDGERVEVRSRK